MNFKRFSTSDNQWHDIPHYIHETATDTLTLPAVIYPNDTSITVGIKGQSSQASTPSPSQPCDVVGCGERTGNLLPFDDKNFVITAGNSNLTVECKNGNLFFQGNAGEIGSSQVVWKNNFAFELEAGTYYCNTPAPLGQGFGRYIKKYDDNATILTSTNYTFTLSEKTKCYLSFYIYQKTIDTKIELMLNLGSTALPYEPYGYKIPISCGGTTNNVYLGEVQTTRQIKKLVLTGEENWNASSTYTGSCYAYLTNVAPDAQPYSPIVCTHVDNQPGAYQYGNGRIDYNALSLWLFDSAVTAADFKSYLAQQYAAGTPVCVWYVLATEETAVVNEPLMKIGTYADSLTTSIPCTAGENTLDVQTTVQPSEVTAGFSGWHPVQSVHERENGQWD